MSYKTAFSFCHRALDFNSPIHRDIIAFVCEFVCETIQATNYHYWVSIFSETGRQDLLVVVREKLDRSNFWKVYREIFNFVADRLKMDFDLVVVEESKKEETLRRLGAYLLISKT